jgi:hypothetical protein
MLIEQLHEINPGLTLNENTNCTLCELSLNSCELPKHINSTLCRKRQNNKIVVCSECDTKMEYKRLKFHVNNKNCKSLQGAKKIVCKFCNYETKQFYINKHYQSKHCLSRQHKIAKNTTQKLLQINSTTNIVSQEFRTALDASLKTNIPLSIIYKSCETCEPVDGFLWKFDEFVDTTIPDTSNRIRRKVVQLNLTDNTVIETFESITDAYQKTFVDVSQISKCCLNKRKQAGGFKWQYYSNEN